MEPIIKVEHLTKRYKGAAVAAVDDISFEVEPGELSAFLGPSGAGTSATQLGTTIRVMGTAGSSPNAAPTSSSAGVPAQNGPMPPSRFRTGDSLPCSWASTRSSATQMARPSGTSKPGAIWIP